MSLTMTGRVYGGEGHPGPAHADMMLTSIFHRDMPNSARYAGG